MVSVTDKGNLQRSLGKLKDFGVVPAVADRLDSGAEATAAVVYKAVIADIPAYRESGNPEVLPGLSRHVRHIVEDLLRLLAGGRTGEFAWVRDYAEIRARQKFPLEALLSAYRLAHQRLSVWIRDAALDAADEHAELRRVVAAAADFGIEYFGAIGPLLTAAYVDHTRLVAEAEGDRRQSLMNLLLDGYDEADARTAKLLRGAGYLEQRQSYCVAIARSVNAAEMENPARAQRMADAVAASLAGAPLRVIVGVRDNRVLAVMSATRRQSGWTAPQSALAERVYPLLRTVGTAALIGLSSDVPSTAHVPRAAAEARFALDSATVAERVLPYASIPFVKLVAAHAQEDVRAALPGWSDAFLAANNKSRDRLAATLRAYADADMNAQKAAAALNIHANTLYARMRRIEDLTGRNPLRYHVLTEMLLVLDCALPSADSAA